jgi:hypothetical protein
MQWKLRAIDGSKKDFHRGRGWGAADFKGRNGEYSRE